MAESESGFYRRHLFEKTGAAVAATAFTIVRPEAVRGSQANSKISVGLIGVGGRGSYDATIFHNDPRAHVTALCDLFDDRIEVGIQKIKLDKPTVTAIETPSSAPAEAPSSAQASETKPTPPSAAPAFASTAPPATATTGSATASFPTSWRRRRRYARASGRWRRCRSSWRTAASRSRVPSTGRW